MTYHQKMETKPITIVETPAFLNLAKALWTNEERSELIDYVARNPENGDVIPGTGGVRNCDGGGLEQVSVAVHEWCIFTIAQTRRSTCCWLMQRLQVST
jgi:hypothetical protein